MAVNYRDNSSSAEDNKSSGIVLLGVGVLGVIFIVLGLTNVLPFRFANPYLFYGLMMALFCLFLVMGFVSLINARNYRKKAKSEIGIKDELIKWCSANLDPETIDSRLEDKAFSSDEEKYFSRCEIISEILKKQFINLDPAMLEDIIDKKIYDMVFGESAG